MGEIEWYKWRMIVKLILFGLLKVRSMVVNSICMKTRKIFLSIGIIFIFTGISYGDEKIDNSKFDIPYDFLIDSRKEEARQLVEKHSIFRSMQEIEFNIDKSIMAFMLDHPGFLSVALKVTKIRDYVVKKDTTGGYTVDDKKGTSGRIEMIYSSDGQKYFYGAGEHKGIFIDVIGKGLILFEYYRDSINPSRTIVGYNTYTKIENVVLEFFMKILKPFLSPLIDRKINKFVKETQKLANEITTHPEKVYQAIKESGFAEEKEFEEFRKLVF